ncbi:MAG: hypothetical protein ACK47B_11965 [Armatimonadota bacterium]
MISRPWQEWLADNPFLRLTLLRWVRRRTLRRALLISASPVGLALGLIAFYGWSIRRPLLPGAAGYTLLGAVVAAQWIAVLWSRSSGISLFSEAVTGRLTSWLLLPRNGRRILGLIGIERAALGLLAAVVPLPIYVVALALGGPKPQDLLTAQLVMLALLFRPPTPLEVRSAFQHLQAKVDRQPARRDGCFGWSSLRMIVVQLALGMLLTSGTVQNWLQPVGVWLGRLLAAAWAGGIDPVLLRGGPLTAPVVLLRLLWVPRPFFTVVVPPLVPVGLAGLVYLVVRWREASEMWDAAPDAVAEGTRDGDRSPSAAVLGAVTGIVLLGFFWLPLHAVGGSVLAFALLLWIGGLAGWRSTRIRKHRPRAEETGRVVRPNRPRDALERWLDTAAAREDNPLITLQVRRQLRSRVPLLRQGAQAALLTLAWSALIPMFNLGPNLVTSSATWAAVLSPRAGEQFPPLAAVAMWAGSVTLVLGAVGIWLRLSTSPHVPGLKLTPAGARTLLQGHVTLAWLRSAPLTAGIGAGVLVWTLVAAGAGAPIFWVAIYLVACASAGLLLVHGSLLTFRGWVDRKDRLSDYAVPAALTAVVIGTALELIYQLPSSRDYDTTADDPLRLLFRVLCFAGPVVLALLLPTSYRLALASLGVYRRE